jgi:hypothetical protein
MVGLLLQESAVVRYQPVSLPRRPAHLVAVDASRKQLLLVVRGTSQLADVLADLVAHTSPLGPGGCCSLTQPDSSDGYKPPQDCDQLMPWEFAACCKQAMRI